MSISIDDWEAQFRPVINHLNLEASFADEEGRGILFETYGIENLYVQNHIHENRVWTWVDGDDGTYIMNGYHLVNRIGYFVTEVPYNADKTYDIVVDKYSEHEEEVQ
jgi:hypothetical protein